MTNTEPSAAALPGPRPERRVHPRLIALAWLWVVIPFLYGFWNLLANVPRLFAG